MKQNKKLNYSNIFIKKIVFETYNEAIKYSNDNFDANLNM